MGVNLAIIHFLLFCRVLFWSGQIGEGLYEMGGEIGEIFFESGLFGVECFKFSVLYLEFDVGAGDGGQINCKILHSNKIIKKDRLLPFDLNNLNKSLRFISIIIIDASQKKQK